MHDHESRDKLDSPSKPENSSLSNFHHLHLCCYLLIFTYHLSCIVGKKNKRPPGGRWSVAADGGGSHSHLMVETGEHGRESCKVGPPRKVMVVADPNRESAAALQYALSHAVLKNDTLILLYVEHSSAWKNPFNAIFRKPSPNATSPTPASSSLSSFSSFSSGGGGGGGGGVSCGGFDFLEALKFACEETQPNLKVVNEKVEITEGKDKGSVILSQCSKHGVDILVIGQRRSLSNALLGTRRSGSSRGLDTADYLIENSKCTCVAVQRKGQNAGYLLNTKTHKNFWLLA